MSTVEIAVIGFLGLLALATWTALTCVEATLAEARAIARTPDGRRRLGHAFEELHRHPRRLLIALAIGREIALAVAAAIAVLAGSQRGGTPGAVGAIGVTAVTMLIARGIAIGTASRRVARGNPIAAGWVIAALAPLSWVARGCKRVGGRLVTTLVGEEPRGENVFAREELAVLSDGDEELAPSERTLVENVVRFGDRPVRQIMTPRRDLVAVPEDVPFDELLHVIHDSGCSRIPVYRIEKDDLIGMLYVRDLIGVAPAAGGIGPLARQPYVVTGETSVDAVFREFRTRHVHIALVVDEYGSVLGLVTLEDILEELFGEIRDEFDDDEEPGIIRRGPSSFLVSGRVSVSALNARLKLQIPLSQNEATIAGLVIDRLGRVPDRGERVAIDGCVVTVEKLDGPAIERVRVDVWPSQPSS